MNEIPFIKSSIKDLNIQVIYYSRKNFYNKEIYWYEFKSDNYIHHLIPKLFLNVLFTKYYEFGGIHQEAILELTKSGFTDIIDGGEI